MNRDLNDACCHQCQVRPSTFMCRPSLSPCDQAEYCTGTLPSCPPDRGEKDGTICSNMDSLRCASGQCTSRDQQCLARGYTMNITRACSVKQEECKMLCEYPDDSAKCTLFSADFLDGTLCGTDGKCLNGLCLEAQGTQPSVSPAVLVAIIMTTVVLVLSSFGCWLWIKKKKGRKQQSPQLSACSSLTLVDNRVCKWFLYVVWLLKTSSLFIFILTTRSWRYVSHQTESFFIYFIFFMWTIKALDLLVPIRQWDKKFIMFYYYLFEWLYWIGFIAFARFHWCFPTQGK